jgi:pantoate--beta-alanine ligase
MEIVHTIKELKTKLQVQREKGKTIGLVPTMGALHAGHASLVKRSVNENDVTVVSVFVNPTQFNDKKDLEKYPRTLEADCELLERIGANIVFAPSVSEMYPEPDTRVFSYPPTDEVMEGRFRPGHFNGVCQIVSKLFMIVEPNKAYFGEKDFQQIAVIKAMVADQKYPLEICPCPIVRETDGLALSSRNTLLSEAERKIALNISKTLFESLEYAKTHTLTETKYWVINTINAIEGLEVQYYEIVDGKSLSSLNDWRDSDYIVGCITVFCGSIPVRLIDNIKYKESK